MSRGPIVHGRSKLFGRLLGALELARLLLVPDRRLAQATREKGIVARIRFQPRDARELLIIDGVANLVHSGAIITTLSQKT